jgi:hypothetical protein
MKLIPSADRREGSDQIGLANAVKSMKQETSKALVKMENALQHGAFSRSLLIPGEDGKELQQHMETYREFYKSSGKVEQDIVDKLAFLKWRELRLEKAIASIQRTQMGETSKNLPEPVKKAMDEVKRIRETLHWYSEKIGTFRGVLKRSEDEANAFFISIYRIITGPMSVLHEEQTVSLQPQDEEAGLTLSSAVKGYSDFLEHRRGILHRRLRAARSTFRAVVEKNRSAMESVEAEASLGSICSEVPRYFRPWDLKHTQSVEWLQMHHLDNLWHPSSEMDIAWEIFKSQSMRKAVEQCILWGKSPARISEILRTANRDVPSSAIEMYRYYFFDMSLMLEADMNQYFEKAGLSRSKTGQENAAAGQAG